MSAGLENDTAVEEPRKRGRRPGTMTDEHKQALAVGRDQGRIVRSYLSALGSHRPRRGRKRTTQSIKFRLIWIENHLPSADPLQKLLLLQEKANLEKELTEMEASHEDTFADLEKKFVSVAKDFSKRRGIRKDTWREVGVRDDILKKAGIAS